MVGAGTAVDLRVDDPAVSSRHCEILCRDHAIEVRDLGSKNGLFVGAARVGAALLSEDGATFVIGRTTVTLRHEDETRSGRVDTPEVPGLIGTSAPMRRVAEQIRRYAASRVPVLLQGESGTGKDVVARALHTLSGRSGAYVPLNVNAFPESLADSELFGHRRGAYTGAAANRAGAFGAGPPGHLVSRRDRRSRPLDSSQALARGGGRCGAPHGRSSHDHRRRAHRVSELGAPHGARGARALSCRPISPVGGRDNRASTASKAEGDILAFSRSSLLQRMRSDVGEKRLSIQALSRLEEHDWPGNVRELGSVLYRAALAAPGEEILSHHVDLPVADRRLPAEVLDAERAALLLAEHGGNVSRAARAAKVPRSTLADRIPSQVQNPLVCSAITIHSN